MRKNLDYLHDLVVRLDDRLDDLTAISIKQQAILEEHQRRSLANEKAVDLLAEELKPIKEHVAHVNSLVKIVSVFGAIILFAITLWQAVD